MKRKVKVESAVNRSPKKPRRITLHSVKPQLRQCTMDAGFGFIQEKHSSLGSSLAMHTAEHVHWSQSVQVQLCIRTWGSLDCDPDLDDDEAVAAKMAQTPAR